LHELAEHYRASGYAVVLKDAFADIFEFAQRIVGMENRLMMMITNGKAACALFDKLSDSHARQRHGAEGSQEGIRPEPGVLGRPCEHPGGPALRHAEEVKDDVRRNIEALAPGGGYVFNTIHNIQADVPPANIIAMWEALQDCGVH